MFKRLNKMSGIIRFSAIFVIMALLSGCGTKTQGGISDVSSIVQEMGSDSASEKAGEYRKYFENIRISKTETVSDPNVEQYKKDYYLLMADFMSGGFTTNQNLDYLNNEYPQEFYSFCIEDLNGDGGPEFMLGYGYNGEDPTYWEIFKPGNSYDECYVGAVMYFDRENGILFDSYGSDMYAYIFDGERLTRKFSYYMDGEECREDASSEDGYVQKYYYEDESLHKWELTEQTYNRKISGYYDKENIRFVGKRLTPENLADDLGIDRNSWEKERALRSYLGILHYFSKHTDCDYMKDFRYALVNIDNDDIPEMVAVNNGRMDLFFYRNGRWLRQSGSDTDDGDDVHHFSFFPKKNIYKSSTSNWGNRQEEFYTIRDELTECVLVAREEVMESAFDNGFQRDSDGKLLYNYCVNENIVTEKEYIAVKAALYDVFDLGEEVRFEDLESFFYQDMMTYLEKQTGYYYR